MAITLNNGAHYNNRNLESNIIWESEAQTSLRCECLHYHFTLRKRLELICIDC